MSFTWIPYYKEFAQRLTQFQKDRKRLLNLIYNYRDELLAKYLHDQGGEGDLLEDIDPFTVFGLFNRGIKHENRINSAKLFKNILDIKADIPKDFEGIPVLNNQKSHFFGFRSHRGKNDIQNLWNLFIKVVNDENFEEEYNTVIKQFIIEKREIDKDEIEAIISQIQLGHCDQLFYIEPDNYFSENIRLKTLRYIAKRWVREVFGKSKLDRSQNPIVIVYPTNWWLGYTLGERLGIAVLRERISLDEYFDEQGFPKGDSIKHLIADIDRGLWDSSFFWDIENYRSVTATSSLNNIISQLLNNNQNYTIQKKEE